MNLNPLYELRERLSACAIAGVNLISEDFRLARAIEQMSALKDASAVFKKIYDMACSLVSPDCKDRTGTLLDALALADAVICTQGITNIQGDLTSIEVVEGTIISDIPYSILSPLVKALTETGGGRYSVIETYLEQVQIKKDYRLRHLLIHALGDSYSEIAGFVENWLSKEDESIIPLLKKGLDPKGKAEMARRVKVIAEIAGAKENEYYLSLLEVAKGKVRQEVINALRFEQNNEDILIQLMQSEKALCKEAAYASMAYMNSPRALQIWKKKLKENSGECTEHLRFQTSDKISDLIAEELNDILEELIQQKQTPVSSKQQKRLSNLFYMSLGKASEKMCDFYRKAASKADILKDLKSYKDKNEKELETPTISIEEYSSLYFYSRYIELSDAPAIALLDALLFNHDDRLFNTAIECFGEYGADYMAPAFAAALLTQKKEEVFEKFSPFFAGKEKWGKEKKEKKKMRMGIMEVLQRIYYDEVEHRYQIIRRYNMTIQKETTEIAVESVLKEELDTRWFSILTQPQINHEAHYRGEDKRYSYSLDFDGVLERLINTDSKECCQILGTYFYRQALLAKESRDTYRYITDINRCKFKDCKGLIAAILPTVQQNIRVLQLYRILSWLEKMPLTKEELAEEVDGLIKLIEKEKEKLKFDIPLEQAKEKMEMWIVNLKAGKEHWN